MSKYNFSPHERYAVYTAHREKCYLCTNPIDLQSMEVDHIIPESLLAKPKELREVLNNFGLDKDFDLNTPSNWLPTCSACNGKKSNTVFTPSPLIQLQLQKAAKKASRVIEIKNKSTSKVQITKALNLLQRAANDGELTEEHKKNLQPLIAFHAKEREIELKGAPLKITPLYTVVGEDKWSLTIQGPAGVGRRPKGENLHPSWDCPNCGSIAAWNGARCVICGIMNDE